MHVYLAIFGLIVAVLHPQASGHVITAAFALSFFTVSCATLLLAVKLRAERPVPAAYLEWR
jgi:hypothetical protein